ncbi:MAG: Uma2 family endonuclease [Chloroflexi bacterium]|nr:Uma2 family endonuclease [Chloroflexota bacterium]
MTTAAKITLAEFLAREETEPGSEYVDGEVVQKPMPTLAHMMVQHLLSLVVGLFLRSTPIGIAGPEPRCTFSAGEHELSRLPDFVFIAAERLEGANGSDPFVGAPDLAVEILSPDDRMSKVMEKLRLYLSSGVRLVWLIDPRLRTVMVMTAPNQSRILTEDEILDGGDVMPGFSTVVRDLLPPPELPIA